MITGIIIAMIRSLLMTLALEVGFFLMIGIRGKRELTLCILANIMTNPVVTSIYYYCAYFKGMFGTEMIVITAVLEMGAVIAEWLSYTKEDGIKNPFGISLYANAFSFGVGLLMRLLP